MLFSKLLEASEVLVKQRRGDAEIRVLTADSRRCEAGSCFVAVRGPGDDGHRYIPAALSAGAAAVICEDPSEAPGDIPCAVVDGTQMALGKLAQAFYGWPGRRLKVIGVTGTKGKSTVTYLVRAILEQAGFRPALVGTISYETGKRSIQAGNTTPGPIELADMMAECVSAGMTHLVMEVSSHALHQRRTAGIAFQVGIFTNLSGDHLDYHLTMEDYLLAKQLLFEDLSPDAAAVINRDDPVSDRLAAATRAKVIWYGLSAASDFRARIDQIDTSGTQFVLIHGNRERPVKSPLIGRHNVFNCLAAAGACHAIGIGLATIAAALERVSRVPGRLERVNVPAPYQVFVDYAHTDDALDKALGSVRPITKGRVIVVFGCGGNRDRTKRPRMARVAQELADVVVITSDNPRNEEPRAIIDEILTGLSDQGRRRALVEPDRRKAIEMAIAQARDGDLVLIAGKGHENYQIIGGTKRHFDDTEVAQELMRRREAIA